MKTIKLENGVTLETPWLTAAEAARYCSMGLRTFQRHAQRCNLARSIRSSKTCYNTSVLDRFLEGAPETNDDIRPDKSD